MKFLFLSLVSLTLFASEFLPPDDKTVSALHATYEDGTLVLEGEVQVEHGIGTLLSEKAFLYKDRSNVELPFSSVTLRENVRISSKSSGMLRCDNAELNLVTLTGKLTSEETKRVGYSDTIHSVPVEVTGKTIDLSFETRGNVSYPDYICNNITINEDVEVSYGEDFKVKSHKLNYIPNSEGSDFLGGILLASPASPGSHCKLVYGGEEIETSFIEIDPGKHELRLKNPKGSLPSGLFSKSSEGRLFLRSQDLVWDHRKKVLILQKNVELTESAFGTLNAADSVTVEQSKSGSPGRIRSIKVPGASTLRYEGSLLDCYGSLHLDGVKGRIVATSPKISGKTDPSLQVSYESEDLKLRADEAVLEYALPLPKLSSLTFVGNIRIESPGGENPLRFAVADRLSYSPDTKTVILSAIPGKKVLFWDKEEGLVISAKEVHLTQNPLTSKTEIKGVGNMKLSLSPEEQSRLKSHFPTFPEKEVPHVE